MVHLEPRGLAPNTRLLTELDEMAVTTTATRDGEARLVRQDMGQAYAIAPCYRAPPIMFTLA
jgi:hypothetical protein